MSWAYSIQLDDIETKLDNLTLLVNALSSRTTKGFNTMSLDYSKVTAAVTKETTVEASVKVLLSQLATSVASLKAEVANAPDMNEIQSKLDAFAATISGNADDLATAVTSNTPVTDPVSNTTPANTVANVSSNSASTVVSNTAANTANTFSPSGN